MLLRFVFTARAKVTILYDSKAKRFVGGDTLCVRGGSKSYQIGIKVGFCRRKPTLMRRGRKIVESLMGGVRLWVGAFVELSAGDARGRFGCADIASLFSILIKPWAATP